MTTIQLRRDTAANWSSNNPVLAQGEAGYDTTNKLLKIGDGSTAWNDLPQYGGGSDYNNLINKPQINSVELDGDVSLNNLDLYSQTEINNALGQKQDKLATQAPLKVSSVTTTNQTNCTYTDGTATALGTARGTGTCSYTDYLGEKRMSVSGYNSTTDGVHINYPFSIASSAESALCYPLSYVYGYYNEDGKFVFLLTTTKRSKNQAYSYSYSIANNDLLVVNGSSKFITDIIDLEVGTTQTSWSTLNYSKIYCPDGLSVGNNLHIDFLQLTDDGTFTVFNQRTVTLTNALITQLSKINIATYNISTNTEGETRTILPIRDASGNIVFNGDTGGSITSNTLQLEISSQANNILEVETDGLYVPNQSYTLPVATTSALGGVKIGSGVTITSDGALSVDEELANTPDEVQALSSQLDTLNTNLNGLKFWSGTQTAYDGIATKDPNTLYIITG